MDKPHQFTVEEGAQLLPYLLAKFPSRGRNKVKALLTRGQVVVGGRVVTRHDYALKPGDEVQILSTGAIEQRQITAGMKIVYEDQAIIVIDKPPGLLSIATDDEKERTAYHLLTDHVKQRNPRDRVFIVHRLDRDTSGLMLFAKSPEVKNQLQQHWEEAVVERAYVALVEGLVKDDAGTIDTWLKESKTMTMYVTRPGDGMHAVTHYKVIERGAALSLLEVRLETGRKNQIRVHMQSIGHSVVGDKRYGAKANPLGRLGLHARVLSFHHPLTGKVLRFETGIPKDFRKVIVQES